MANPPAWHPDPTGRHEHRYWDGEQWTDHVANAGESSTDPLDGGAGDRGSSAHDSGSAAHDSGGEATGDPGVSSTSSDPAASGPATAETPDRSTIAVPIESTSAPGASAPSFPAAQGAAPGGPGAGGPPGGTPGGPGGSTFPAAAPSAGQPASGGSNGAAVAALIIGILSLLIAFIPFIGLVGTVGGIAALILGIVGRKKAKQINNGAGMAITGIITGVLAIILSLVVTVGLALFFQNVGSGFVDEFNNLDECIQETGDEEGCIEEFEESLFGRFGS
jgi:hypothetical protein